MSKRPLTNILGILVTAGVLLVFGSPRALGLELPDEVEQALVRNESYRESIKNFRYTATTNIDVFDRSGVKSSSIAEEVSVEGIGESFRTDKTGTQVHLHHDITSERAAKSVSRASEVAVLRPGGNVIQVFSVERLDDSRLQNTRLIEMELTHKYPFGFGHSYRTIRQQLHDAVMRNLGEVTFEEDGSEFHILGFQRTGTPLFEITLSKEHEYLLSRYLLYFASGSKWQEGSIEYQHVGDLVFPSQVERKLYRSRSQDTVGTHLYMHYTTEIGDLVLNDPSPEIDPDFTFVSLADDSEPRYAVVDVEPSGPGTTRGLLIGGKVVEQEDATRDASTPDDLDSLDEIEPQ